MKCEISLHFKMVGPVVIVCACAVDDSKHSPRNQRECQEAL